MGKCDFKTELSIFSFLLYYYDGKSHCVSVSIVYNNISCVISAVLRLISVTKNIISTPPRTLCIGQHWVGWLVNNMLMNYEYYTIKKRQL